MKAATDHADDVRRDTVNSATLNRDDAIKQAAIVRAAALQTALFALAEALDKMKDLEVSASGSR